jgi:hypothetical protein
MRIAPGIHRTGDNSIINAYLVEQGGEVTIIDAGILATTGSCLSLTHGGRRRQ